jgi:N-acetylglucosaminyldiphosphoundecaprenol N-acetyl-beta-D-mannosaminyltransferase
MPLVWYANFKFPEQTVQRVYGPDLMLAMFKRLGSRRDRHLLFGGNLQTSQKLKLRLEAEFPQLHLVGSVVPPFDTSSNLVTLAARAIEKNNATVLWLGLSTPKQVEVAAGLARQFPQVSIFCVGAAFEFLAGTKPMAPKWLQKYGFEWLFRLFTEPRRLARRYLVIVPSFLLKKLGLALTQKPGRLGKP